MKRNLLQNLCLLAAATSLIALVGCGKPPKPIEDAEQKVESAVDDAVESVIGAKIAKSAVKNPFGKVVPYLDLGGEFFLYFSTEQLLSGMSDRLEAATQELAKEQVEGVEESTKQEALKISETVAGILSRTGVENIAAFGVSSLQVKPELNRVQAILYHEKGQGDGTLWKLFGSEPHQLELLGMTPANTAYAFSFDFSPNILRKAILAEAEALGVEELTEEMKGFEQQFEKEFGASFEAVLESLNDEIGLILTLNEEKMVEAPDMKVQIPEPGLAIFLGTSSSLIFDKLKEKGLPEPEKADGYRYIALPMPPMAEYLAPVLAQLDNGYLAIASSQPALDKMLAASKGEGLTSTEDFKTLAADLELKGNSFTYLGESFSKTLATLQEDFNAPMTQNPYLNEVIQMAQSMQSQNAAFGISRVTPEGFHWITHTRGPAPDSPDAWSNVAAKFVATLIFGAVTEAAMDQAMMKEETAPAASDSDLTPAATPTPAPSPAATE